MPTLEGLFGIRPYWLKKICVTWQGKVYTSYSTRATVVQSLIAIMSYCISRGGWST